MMKKCFVLLAAVLVVSGCAKKSPCEQLEAAVCKDAGSEICANTRREVADADEAMQTVCEQLVLVLPPAGETRDGCDELADMVCSERPLQDCLNMRKEAVGADEKKVKVCEQFKVLIINTRRTNSEKADRERAALNGQAAPAAATAPATAPATGAASGVQTAPAVQAAPASRTVPAVAPAQPAATVPQGGTNH